MGTPSSSSAPPRNFPEPDRLLLKALHRRRLDLAAADAGAATRMQKEGFVSQVSMRGRKLLELSPEGVAVAESLFGPRRAGNVGGARLGAGAKPIAGDGVCRRTQVTLDDETHRFLSQFGGGNLSQGIRIAGARLRDGYDWVDRPLSAGLVLRIQKSAIALARSLNHARVRTEHALLACEDLDEVGLSLPPCAARKLLFADLRETLARSVAMAPTPSRGLTESDYQYSALVEHIRYGHGLLSFFMTKKGEGVIANLLMLYGFLPRPVVAHNEMPTKG